MIMSFMYILTQLSQILTQTHVPMHKYHKFQNKFHKFKQNYITSRNTKTHTNLKNNQIGTNHPLTFSEP